MVVKKEGWGGERRESQDPTGQQIEMRYMRACIYRDDTRRRSLEGDVFDEADWSSHE